MSDKQSSQSGTPVPDERREGYLDLAEQLATHLQHHEKMAAEMKSGNLVLGNNKTLKEHWKDHEMLFEGHKQIIEAIAGKERRDVLTDEITYEGGMRQDVGALKLSVGKLEHQASNGGVNAKVKFSTSQKVTIAVVAIPGVAAAVVGVLALLQTLLERS